MSLTDQLRFMFTTLHGGAVNLTLHLASSPGISCAGLARRRRVSWIVVAGMMEVAGHAWNMLFRFDREQRRTALRVPAPASIPDSRRFPAAVPGVRLGVTTEL